MHIFYASTTSPNAYLLILKAQNIVIIPYSRNFLNQESSWLHSVLFLYSAEPKNVWVFFLLLNLVQFILISRTEENKTQTYSLPYHLDNIGFPIFIFAHFFYLLNRISNEQNPLCSHFCCLTIIAL